MSRTKELNNFQQKITDLLDNKPTPGEAAFFSPTDQMNEFEEFIVQTAKDIASAEKRT
jgi:hypothetical protein